jgi:preprotein translocase subunit SecF
MMIDIAFRLEFADEIRWFVSFLHGVAVAVWIGASWVKPFSRPLAASVLIIFRYSINDKVIIFDLGARNENYTQISGSQKS